MNRFEPAYLALLRAGVLEARAAAALAGMRSCTGCGWACRVDRAAGPRGHCRTGPLAMVSSYGAHHGEERPLSGWRGSGTIFFTRCNLRCQYCQNFDISQTGRGSEVTSEQLAGIMLRLQAAGCHNINLVSPSHVVAQILAAVLAAANVGLRLPLVYNTGGYDSLESLRLLEGVVDIYMPDMKYADEAVALRYSKIPGYPAVNRRAVREMHRQVGDLIINTDGLAVRGLLVRHLVLPNGLAGTAEIARFLSEHISPETFVNIMGQYHPAYHAGEYPEINRRITPSEYQDALIDAQRADLTRLAGD